MRLAPWDLAHTSKTNGSVALGALPIQTNPSLIKSYSVWWSPHTFGVHNGINATSSSVRTTRQWCTFLRPGCQRSRPLYRFYSIYCPRQLNIILPLQQYICQAFIIQLLMLSLIFVGRSSRVWHRRLYHTQFQFVNSFEIF